MSHWSKLLGMMLLLLAIVSCRPTLPNLKPPPEPETYTLPPNSPRYTGPFEYPKEYLYQDPFAKQKARAASQKGGIGPRPGGPGRPR